MHKFLRVSVIIMIIIVLVGCSGENESPQDVDNQQNTIDNGETQSNEDIIDSETESSEEVESSQEDHEENTKEDMVLFLMSKMTLEEKIGQLFICDIYSMNQLAESKVMTDFIEEAIDEYHLGGVILFGPNIETPDQVRSLIGDMQNASDLPLFIAVDEEGGIVRRIGDKEVMNFVDVPTASELGDINDYQYTYNLAFEMATQMLDLGFNMDFAPVADVDTNPDNPVIGDRAFSDDPMIVADMVAAFSGGLQDAGVLAVAKHFPGHGDTLYDTHTGDVYVDHDMSRLEEIELIPFQRAIEDGVAGIMSAHIILENVTGHDKPATFSPELLIDLLRDDYGFEGLIISDALVMDAISRRYSPDQVGVEALLAGMDVLLMPYDIETMIDGIIEAVESGILTEERINESVYRILTYKLTYNIIEND